MARDDNDTLREEGRGALDPSRDLEPVNEEAAPVVAPVPLPAQPATLERLAPLLSTVLLSATDELEGRAMGTTKPIPLPWPSLAAHLGGGLWPGLHVLVGNTGSGKSQLAAELTHHAARQGVPAAYVALELDYPGMVARLGALEIRERLKVHVPWSALYLGESREALKRLVEVSPHLAALPLHVVAAPPMGWNYQDMRAVVEGMRAKYPTGPLLLVLDFLQLVSDTDGADLRERIGRAAYVGRAAARDLGASVILVSSTARENYKTLAGEGTGLGEGPPSRLVGLGKESGEIEYAADTLLALARSNEEPDRTWCAVAKVRARSARVRELPEGPAREGWIPLSFDGTTFREDPNAVVRPREAAAPSPSPAPGGYDDL